jgi:type I restriction enzyme S subunit
MIKFVLENFDTIFRNEKSLESLNKIILDLAIRGKLVEQNPEDEPVSELLKRIKEEKERLIKEKVIKKEKELLKIEEDEIPFEIPESWEWVRLGEIGIWGSGATPSRSKLEYYQNGDIPWLKTGELNDSYIYNSEEKITKLALEKTSLRLCKAKDVLIAMYGATIGKLGILEIEATTNQACCACTVYQGIYYKFLFYFLMARRESFKSQGAGGAQPNISKEKIINSLFTLPSLAEQKRIVEKVERLQGLIKNLKEVYLLNEESRLNLKKSLLAEIEKSNSDKELLKNLELVFSNFDKVIRSKEDIKDIRNLILSLAIKGKLVEQNSEDEPASELLTRIKEEKERLIKEKVIKKEKELPKIEKDEIPFEIPKSWEWVRLGEILNLLTDGAHKTPKYVENGVPFLSVKNMSNGKLNFDDVKYITQEEHIELSKRCNVEYGDLLLTKVGTTGIPVIVDTYREFNIFVSVALLKFNKNCIDVKFLRLLLQSPFVYNQSQENTKGVGNKNWVLKDISNTKIILPPLAEQQRIVERVEKLMSICDMLEEKIVESERVSEKLLESLVKYEG